MQVSRIKNVISSVLKEYFNDTKIKVKIWSQKEINVCLVHSANVRGSKKSSLLGEIKMDNPGVYFDNKPLFHVHSNLIPESQKLNYGKDLYCCAINFAESQGGGIISGPIRKTQKTEDAMSMTRKLMNDKNIRTIPVLVVESGYGKYSTIKMIEISEDEIQMLKSSMPYIERREEHLNPQTYTEEVEKIIQREEDPYEGFDPDTISICYIHFAKNPLRVSIPIEYVDNDTKLDHNIDKLDSDAQLIFDMKRLWVNLIRSNDKKSDSDKIPQSEILSIAREINSIEKSEDFDIERINFIIERIKSKLRDIGKISLVR